MQENCKVQRAWSLLRYPEESGPDPSEYLRSPRRLAAARRLLPDFAVMLGSGGRLVAGR